MPHASDDSLQLGTLVEREPPPPLPRAHCGDPTSRVTIYEAGKPSSRCLMAVPSSMAALLDGIEERLGFRPAHVFLGETNARVLAPEDLREDDELRCEPNPLGLPAAGLVASVLELTIRDMATSAEAKLRIAPTTRVAELFRFYAAHQGITTASIHFVLGGTRIHVDSASTLADHGLKHGDSLLASLQTGTCGYPAGPRVLRLAKFFPD